MNPKTDHPVAAQQSEEMREVCKHKWEKRHVTEIAPVCWTEVYWRCVKCGAVRDFFNMPLHAMMKLPKGKSDGLRK